MAAFVTLVKTYAVFIYLFLTLGILFGIKMLVDAQRLSRATLFSLDQERATQQTYSALVVMVVSLIGMFITTGIVVLVVPFTPNPEPPILRGPTPTLAAYVFPTNTRAPTLSPTLPPPSETSFVTATPIQATATHTAIKPTLSIVVATPTPPLPAPILIAPPNNNVFIGEGQMNGAMTFKWDWKCDQCTLGPDDRFVIVITYTDKSGKLMTIGSGPRNNYLTMGDIVRGGAEVYQKALDDKFQWYIQVKRGDQPLTAPSDTWKFVWH